jgi:hypothetical protein
MVQDIMGDICLLVDRCQRCNNNNDDHTAAATATAASMIIDNNNSTNNGSGITDTATDTGDHAYSTPRVLCDSNDQNRFISWRINAEQRLLLGTDNNHHHHMSPSSADSSSTEGGLSGLTGMWHKGSSSGVFAEIDDRIEWMRAKEEAKAVDALDSLMACFKGTPLSTITTSNITMHCTVIMMTSTII